MQLKRTTRDGEHRAEDLTETRAGDRTETPTEDRVDDRRSEGAGTDQGVRRGRAAQLRERVTGQAGRPGPAGRIGGARTDEAGEHHDGGEGGRAVVTEDDIQVITRGEDLGIYRAHRRFGGFDLGAALAGLLAAIGMTALLGGIAGAIGTVGYQLDVQRDEEALSAGGFAAGLVILVLSFLVGGWVAGRVARYDGGPNGFATALFFVVLAAALAGAGAGFGEEWDVLDRISLPQWFTSDTSTTVAVLSAVAAVVVMLAAGWLGGVIGSRYHHKADAYLAEYAQGGRPVTAETLMDDSGRRRSRLLRR